MIRNGHFVFNFSDRDVARAGSWLGHRKFGIKAANRALLEFCANMRPDLLVLGHADVMRPETIAAIRQTLPNIKIIQWNVDPVFEPDNIGRINSKLDLCDATIVSTAGEALAPLARLGKILGFMPNPVDFSIESGRAHEQANLPYDLFYACGNQRQARFTCGADWLPPDLINRIERDVPGVRLRLAGMRDQPHLTGAAYQTALEQSAIGLNLSRRSDVLLYTSDRLAHMCGNGLAILLDTSTGYQQFFTAAEIGFFSTIDDLTRLVREFKADPAHRMAVAAAGRAKYHALFNEQIIADYLVKAAFGSVNPADYSWPTLYRP